MMSSGVAGKSHIRNGRIKRDVLVIDPAVDDATKITATHKINGA